VATFDRIAELPIEIDSYELEGLEFQAGEFERLTTIVRIQGRGEEGAGEDVVYDAVDHVALQSAGPVHDLTGPSTMGELCELVGGLDLFTEEPVRDVSRRYRRWAFESAALDLALRQAGKSLHEVLDREVRPVTFVCSMRLAPIDGDEPSSIEPLKLKLKHHPDLRFKLDPTNDWTDELIAELVEAGAVDSLDLKGFYKDTPVDVVTDPGLYRKVAGAFPKAWLEDPDLNDETRPVLEPHLDRVTWDAPIHAVDDIDSLPFKPTMVNLKPSRVGSLEELGAAYDHCAEQGIGAYGGGQWELGLGRGQIQYLASLFHPDTPNDVAPTGYNNQREPGPDLPDSPLDPAPSATGFRWGG
jgi:hypothetical protein